jgi:hypothetical protein
MFDLPINVFFPATVVDLFAQFARHKERVLLPVVGFVRPSHDSLPIAVVCTSRGQLALVTDPNLGMELKGVFRMGYRQD